MKIASMRKCGCKGCYYNSKHNIYNEICDLHEFKLINSTLIFYNPDKVDPLLLQKFLNKSGICNYELHELNNSALFDKDVDVIIADKKFFKIVD